ncbi:MAG: GAP family protein, partial [Mycobacterium sp.]
DSQDAATDGESGSAVRRLLSRAHNAWESGALWVAFVIGFWAGPNPSLVIFALTTILTSGAAIGTQIVAAVAFIVETLAVVEIVLVSNLATPTKTQALLRLLHDWVRTRRRQILVAMLTLIGLALVAQGMGSI